MAMVDASQKVQGAEPRLGASSGLYVRVHQTQLMVMRNPRVTMLWIGVWVVESRMDENWFCIMLFCVIMWR